MRLLVYLKWKIFTIYFLGKREVGLIWNGAIHTYHPYVQTTRLRNAASIVLTFKEMQRKPV